MGAGLLPLAQRSGTLHSVVRASWPSARGRGAARLSRALAVSSLRRSADGSVRLGHALGSVQGLRSGRTLGGGLLGSSGFAESDRRDRVPARRPGDGERPSWVGVGP